MKPLKIAVLASGRGTVLPKIIEAIKGTRLNTSIELVISNKNDALVLERARVFGIESMVVLSKNKSRLAHEREITKILQEHNINLLLLVGYMRILSPEFVNIWKNKIMNVHPSLLPAFSGLMDLDVHRAVLNSGVTETGCTVHIVDETLDGGEIIVQKKCAVEKQDTPELLKAKVQSLEGDAFIEAIQIFVHSQQYIPKGFQVAVRRTRSRAAECTYQYMSSETSVQQNRSLKGEGYRQTRRQKMNMNPIEVRRALISVSDKTGIVEFAKALYQLGIEIITTGGTAKVLTEAGVPVKSVSEVTEFPEIMQGRLKTLHPKIEGGILAKRDAHKEEVEQHDIPWIDLVVCNLYPFAETIQKADTDLATAIENIDIGGPTMIRAAAKNFEWVVVVVSFEDYDKVLAELQNQQFTFALRKELAIKAFAHTAQYDTVINNYLDNNAFPEKLMITFNKLANLRYGENPHQQAAVYEQPISLTEDVVITAKQHQGKQLSYNNIVDAEGAVGCIKELAECPTCVVVKHANPCGVVQHEDIYQAYVNAWEADSKSAFGSVIALNRECSKGIAEELVKVFVEIIIAPSYEKEALDILQQKKNLRVLELKSLSKNADENYTQRISSCGEARAQSSSGVYISVHEQRDKCATKPQLERRRVYIKRQFKAIAGGMILQSEDNKIITEEELQIVTKTKPTPQEITDLLFSWRVAKYCKSNAIVIAKNQATVGIGSGQVSRIDAVEIAFRKGKNNLENAILASDAFFPFRDSIDRIAGSGISAIIQPGGSIRDEEVIAACDEYGIAMVFTGFRCFYH